jgi:AraC family transcriptional activator of pobA
MVKNTIPKYFVYGEPERQLGPGFVHIELISDRKNLHRGRVEAHSHPNMSQLTCWISGGGSYSIEDRTWSFSAPALCWLPSGTVHGFAVTPRSDAIVLSIADGALANIQNLPATLSRVSRKNRDWGELKTILAMAQRQHAAHHPESLLPLAALALQFADRLMEGSHNSDSATPLPSRLKAMIDSRFRQDVPIADYVKALNSTYHLVDGAARNAFGMPVKRMIMERRLLEAKRLLKFTIRSAEDIAVELGFDDPAYFNRAFKKQTGVAPIAWRKRETLLE